jgi:hypothetical protein
MQARTTIKRFDLEQFKAAAVALGIAASVVVGAATYGATRHNDATVSSTSPVMARAQTSANARFIEINQLPEAALTPINYRFLDMNMLPEAAPQVAPNYRLIDLNVLPGDHAVAITTQADYRFLDRNVLPGDDTRVAGPTFADYRFREMNQLLGEGAELVAPEIVNGTPS